MADIVAISNAAADAAGIPRQLLLACAVAESNLDPNARRPRNQQDDERYWPDVSFGAWQQTVRWSDEYLKAVSKSGGDPSKFPGTGTIEAIGAAYLDPVHAAAVAARNLAPKWAQYQPDMQATLHAYNWPAGGGRPKSPATEANYRRGLEEAARILGAAPVPPSNPAVISEDFRDPAPAGRFTSVPKGVILHGSRSGKAGNPKDQEYLGTARYEQNNPDLGWNATIGEGKVAVHLTPYEWGWNARAASDKYIAVEIAQATVDEEITDAQVAALADYLLTRIFPVWGNLGYHFPTHAELEAWGETGQVDGKSDIYPLGDERVDVVRNRLYALLGAPGWEQPAPDPIPPQPPLAERLSAWRAELEALVARMPTV